MHRFGNLLHPLQHLAELPHSGVSGSVSPRSSPQL